MEMKCEIEIPCLNFPRDVLGLIEEQGDGWRAMSKKVREACESHGCFLFMCDEIPRGLCEEMFKGMKALFDLPVEIKQKHTSPKAYRSYHGNCPIAPQFESFGIDDAPFPEVAEAFTNLMWPQGNPGFSDALKSLSTKLLELCFLIMKMILESYDLPQHYISDAENMKGTSNFRLIKYKVPESSINSKVALAAHTDKSALTILGQNEVQGLQVLTKTGKWVELNVPQEGFVVIVGDILKAWSNGRIGAATHRVVMSGEKERYSFGLFAVPKDEVDIEVPADLVDGETDPLRYRRFNYGEYFNYYVSTLKEDALEAFAGV